MSKVAVVYWSGTGNTEMMAQKVAEGAKEAGAEVSVLTCADFSADDVDAYDAIAFGCPAMGAEELEDTEFEPIQTLRKENRSVRFLWMGRRRVDAHLGRKLQK